MYNVERKNIKNRKVVTKKQTHKSEKFIGLTYGERISRILLVLGMFSVFGVVFKKLLVILQTSFNVVYINSKIPLGLEHFFITVLIGDVAIIFLAGFAYCFTEIFNFTSYKNKLEMINYQKRADKYFKRLLGITMVLIFATLVILFLLEFIFIFNRITKYVIGAIWGIGILVVILTKVVKKKETHISISLKTFELDKNALFIWVVLWLIITVSFVGFGTLSLIKNQKSGAQIKFDNEKGLVINAHFNNKVPEEIVIQTDANQNESIKITKNDFYAAFVEATKESESSKFDVSPSTNQFIYKKSYYEYNNKTDISKLLKNGKNTIVITFKINGVSKDKYKLVNQINYENGRITMMKNDFTISLD